MRTGRPVFVGRAEELATLRDAYARAAGGEPQVVLLDGAAGIGKSALLERFLAGLQDARVLRAAGDESERELPFALADQLLRARSLTGTLAARDHVAVGLELLALLTEPDGPGARVLVVDDAHLADAASLRALLFASRRLTGTPTLVALALRDADDPALPDGFRKLAPETTVHLGRLGAGELRTLAAELEIPVTRGAAQRLLTHTEGNPLHARALLEQLPAATWQYEDRPLPAPSTYSELVLIRLAQQPPGVRALLEAAAVLGARAGVQAALALADVEASPELVDDAVRSGLVRVDEGAGSAAVEFVHPLTRAAVYQSLGPLRRAALNRRAGELVGDPEAALRHRVEAAVGTDDELAGSLSARAQAEQARGAWAAAVSHLLAAARVSASRADGERYVLEAIEATMYSGDGAAAQRLAERARAFADSPRRDSVLAYLAIFASDVGEAERLLERAWERVDAGADPRLASTIAQRRAFVAASRLRGGDALAWADRSQALLGDDRANALLVAPSRALGLAYLGRRPQALAFLDATLNLPGGSPRGSGFVLLATKGRLLAAAGDLVAARAALESSAQEAVASGLPIVAALSLAALTRVEYLAGRWDHAVVAAERALPLAAETEDRWVDAFAHWCASRVPAARGEWDEALARVAAANRHRSTFERHVAIARLATAELAADRHRPVEVLVALEPLEDVEPREGIDDAGVFPWFQLKADALVELGRLPEAERFLAEAAERLQARPAPLMSALLAHAAARLDIARQRPKTATAALAAALALVEPLEMPFEQARILLTQGRLLRRGGQRRAAVAALLDARERLAALAAGPLLAACERELAESGLVPAARKAHDYTQLTAQEQAVARLVVSGMTNREVAAELMLSAKTVEYHLSKVYAKTGVRSRTELRTRYREGTVNPARATPNPDW